MVDVPCNGCTACCRFDLILLHPEDGDVVMLYETMEIINPMTGEPALALKHKPGGGCIYLGDGGCTIHGRAPVICKAFDCRRFYRDSYMGRPRHVRRRMMRDRCRPAAAAYA
jgi:Fe-S-cluster containining protein